VAKPTLKSFAQALYDSMAPMQYDEPTWDYAMAKYLSGVGAMFQVVEDYGRDQQGGAIPGWASLMDPDLCPPEALGWLAQFVGVRLDVGLTVDEQRARIKATDGWKRGTVSAMRGAIAGYLTGSKTFSFRERFDYNNPNVDSPYYMEVVTYTSETPDPVAAGAALLASKPAGIVLHYVVKAGQDYTSVRTNNATYLAVRNKYSTYQNMLLDYAV